MNRIRPIIGGIAVNMTFGSLYAWSIFVLPLEKEFGWNRAQTSWVYTIAVIMTVAIRIVRERVQVGKSQNERQKGYDFQA